MDTTLYLTIPEAAHLLRIAPQTIRNHIFIGDFPIPTILLCGRRLLRRSDVEAFVRGEPMPAQHQNSSIPSHPRGGRKFLRRADVEACVRGEPIPALPQNIETSVVSRRGRPRKQAPKTHGEKS